MLAQAGLQAIKALLELGASPQRWRSVRQLAAAQALPAPMLEQLLLRLRRAGVLEARRGRLGGYRLAAAPEAITLAMILAAVTSAAADGETATPLAVGDAPASDNATATAADASERVTGLLQQRLRRALQRELAQITLADLLYDLSSASAALSEEGGLLLG